MTGGADDGEDIVVAVQGAETAGLDPYLGGPAADVLAACDATGRAGDVTPLAGALLVAGRQSGEPLWRMPLVDGYGDALDSPVADLANVPHSRRPRAGSIEAALFLREFTGGRPWAHLGIAGAARFSDGDPGKGATGFGTRLLVHWLGGFSSA